MSEDEIYFAERAAQERLIAKRSTDSSARRAHNELAELYAARSGQSPTPVAAVR